VSRKRKLRKNTTKGWFIKEAPHENIGTSSTLAEDVSTSSPPGIQEKVIHKMTPKQKSGAY
jgi:hypothetical protein